MKAGTIWYNRTTTFQLCHTKTYCRIHNLKVQVNLVIRAFTVRVFFFFSPYAALFQYYDEHQYPIRGQVLKPHTCVEPSPGLSRNVMHLRAVTIVIRFSFYAAIRLDSTPVCNVSHQYLNLLFGFSLQDLA